jgi:hypothetical protein
MKLGEDGFRLRKEIGRIQYFKYTIAIISIWIYYLGWQIQMQYYKI